VQLSGVGAALDAFAQGRIAQELGNFREDFEVLLVAASGTSRKISRLTEASGGVEADQAFGNTAAIGDRGP
jgi:hypothetical protein